MGKKRLEIDAETRARWDEERTSFREMYERRLQRIAEWEQAENRRKARLRRLTFGLLGR